MTSKRKIVSKLFSRYPEIVFGFSTKKDGDMSWKEGGEQTRRNRARFFKKLAINHENVVSMFQPHGNSVKVVFAKSKGKKIKEVDGLITDEAGVFLQVTVADCVPIFFYDSIEGNTAIAHAGWKGVNKNIAAKVIKEMKKIGSHTENILVFLGPSIKQECYDVPLNRASLFEKWGNRATIRRGGKYYLNLSYVIINQLRKTGIKEKNIEVSLVCTSCNKNFYSNLRDGRIKGLMVGVIGKRND